MKKLLSFTLAVAVIVVFFIPNLWAQDDASDEFTLEEILVTAEKRSVVVQKVPSSVAVIEGKKLAEEGKISTQQILESIPNVTFRSGDGTNPNGNITIRGVQRTQESGGTNSILPSTTATYTDGVYQGIGGNYDVNRVEVLRGPQGTLYGRSATGGVVSFHTNNPELDTFSFSASAEFGEADLRNYKATLNVPYGDKLALRLAWHDFERDGYHGNDEGGHTETSEGRIKFLYQPTDPLEILLSLSYQETTTNGGGYSSALIGPDKIDYKYSYSDVSKGSPDIYHQASLDVNYDFGGSTLTWIAGYHDYDNTGKGAPAVGGDGISWHVDETAWPTDYYHTQEVRLASNDNKQLNWLVGVNYFRHEYDTSRYSYQTDWNAADTELNWERDYYAPIYGQDALGTFDNYGIFTEETFNLTDDFRITAGLRYDKTELVQDMYWGMNANLSEMHNSMNPPIWDYPNPLVDDEHDYDNVTYKLRFEYDVAPDSMLYALTATGFMPGYAALSPSIGMGPGGLEINWNILHLDQQKLTSYEIGTKNQFLNNTLRLNGAVFYYDYEGYPEAVPVAMMGPSPVFGIFAVPLEMFGLEVYAEYLVTMNDKITLDAGWLSAEITEYPTIEKNGENYEAKEFLALKELPGNPDLTATLGYDHTFIFANGSQLVPRLELSYTGGYYLEQMTQEEADATVQGTGHSLKSYNYQDSYILANLGATWTSANDMYSVTGYLRNALDEEYKTGATLSSASASSISPGDPRAFGFIFSVKY
jgi:iron complex outermembrane receptor protein